MMGDIVNATCHTAQLHWVSQPQLFILLGIAQKLQFLFSSTSKTQSQKCFRKLSHKLQEPTGQRILSLPLQVQLPAEISLTLLSTANLSRSLLRSTRRTRTRFCMTGNCLPLFHPPCLKCKALSHNKLNGRKATLRFSSCCLPTQPKRKINMYVYIYVCIYFIYNPPFLQERKMVYIAFPLPISPCNNPIKKVDLRVSHGPKPTELLWLIHLNLDISLFPNKWQKGKGRRASFPHNLLLKVRDPQD